MSKQTAEQAAAEYAYDFLDGLAGASDAFIAGVNWMASQSQWIDVKDALPNFNIDVLVITKRGSRKVDYRQVCNSYGREVRDFRTKDVTHWQPLPEPPTK